MTNTIKKCLFVSVGVVFLTLGVIGIFLPVMPTVPFLVVASACFAKGSTRMHAWLHSNKWFGPVLKNWEEQRAITFRTKVVSTITMAVGIVSSCIFAPYLWAKIAVLVICVLVGIFLWTRPVPLSD